MKPAPDQAVAAELAELAGGAGALVDRALQLLDTGTALATTEGPGPESAADTALRLAAHLVELAWLTAPADPAVQAARRRVFTARAEVATSTMAKGVFRWAAAESGPAAGGHSH